MPPHPGSSYTFTMWTLAVCFWVPEELPTWQACLACGFSEFENVPGLRSPFLLEVTFTTLLVIFPHTPAASPSNAAKGCFMLSTVLKNNTCLSKWEVHMGKPPGLLQVFSGLCQVLGFYKLLVKG